MASVLAPDGRKWTVGRQWLPRSVRLRRRKGEGFSFDDWVAFANLGGGITVIVGIAIAVLVVLVLAVALALELVILLLLLLGGLAGRFTRRRPWRVVARTTGPDPEERAWNVKGWRASGELTEEVARALEAGTDPRPTGAERLDLAPGWYRGLGR